MKISQPKTKIEKTKSMSENTFYSNIRPAEKKELKTAYAIPGIRKVIVFKNNRHDALRKRDAFVSIDVRNKAIRISKAGVSVMGLKEGQRFKFITLDDAIYCVVSKDGNVLAIATRGDMYTKNSLFVHYMRKKMGAFKSFRCSIKLTKSFFDGNPLYELVLPHRYKRSYYRNKKSLA